MRDSMIIYRSFYEAIKDLPKENQAEVWEAVFMFGLDKKESNLSGISATIFRLIKPQLESNLKKYENGKKAKLKISKTEAKQKQNVSKSEANVNVNVNDNVNKQPIRQPKIDINGFVILE